jgi:Fur family ferric uptake transcriptional regulator
MVYDTERATLTRYLESKKLKHTKQRDVILTAFLDAKSHVSAEQLYDRVRDVNAGIGYTTVYRTLKLLVDAGIAQERRFDDGLTRYEVEHKHHDHLVCLKCGRIIEFESDEIEAAQDRIAIGQGFKILHHRHELYGHCSNCQDD